MAFDLDAALVAAGAAQSAERCEEGRGPDRSGVGPGLPPHPRWLGPVEGRSVLASIGCSFQMNWKTGISIGALGASLRLEL